MAVYGYARVSTLDQAQGTSLDEQERRIHAVAMFRGETVARIFTDAGVSGSIALNHRPAGIALVDVAQSGDVIVIAKLDRAFRSAADALTRVAAWRDAGIKLVLADMGVEPVTENGISKLMFTVLAAMAEWERERIIERITEGKRAKKAKGGYIGGKAPFGFTVQGEGKQSVLVPDPEQAAAFETIHSYRSQGYSLRDIAKLVRIEHNLDVSYEAVRRVLAETHDSAEPL